MLTNPRLCVSHEGDSTCRQDSWMVFQIRTDDMMHVSAQAGGDGFGAVLWAHTESGLVIGGSALGGKGMDAVMCGRSAAEELVKEVAHGGCVDTYTQDQVLRRHAYIYLRAAAILLHLRTRDAHDCLCSNVFGLGFPYLSSTISRMALLQVLVVDDT